MSETTPEQNPATETLPGAVAVTPTTATPETKGSGRFAAYDTRLTRYIGGVHDSRKGATDAAKARGVKPGDVKVREV